MVCSLVNYEAGPDGKMKPDLTSVIPMIDGGTEGLKGHARVIFPKVGSRSQAAPAAHAGGRGACPRARAHAHARAAHARARLTSWRPPSTRPARGAACR